MISQFPAFSLCRDLFNDWRIIHPLATLINNLIEIWVSKLLFVILLSILSQALTIFFWKFKILSLFYWTHSIFSVGFVKLVKLLTITFKFLFITVMTTIFMLNDKIEKHIQMCRVSLLPYRKFKKCSHPRVFIVTFGQELWSKILVLYNLVKKAMLPTYLPYVFFILVLLS
jgi:hypothetical protein